MRARDDARRRRRLPSSSAAASIGSIVIPRSGARLLDYKSAEQSVTPEQAHRAGKRGERRWVDLQLPLYELMLRQRGPQEWARRRARARLREPRPSPQRRAARARRVERGRSRRGAGGGARRGARDPRPTVLAARRSAVLGRWFRGPRRAMRSLIALASSSEHMTDGASTERCAASLGGRRGESAETGRAAPSRRPRLGRIRQDASAGAALSRDPVLRRQARLDRGRDLHPRGRGRDPRARPHPARRRGGRRRASRDGWAASSAGRPRAPAGRARAARAVRDARPRRGRDARQLLLPPHRGAAGRARFGRRSGGGRARRSAAARAARGGARGDARGAGRPRLARADRPLRAARRRRRAPIGGALARLNCCSSSTRSISRRRARSCGAGSPCEPGPDADAVAVAVDSLDAALRASAPGALRKALAGDLELGAPRRVGPPARARPGRQARVRCRPRRASGARPSRRLARLAPRCWWRTRAGACSRPSVARTQATHHLLDAFHRHYWRLRRRARRSPVQRPRGGARALARRGSAEGALDELYYRIDERVGHLLLDEFQDTSLAQWSVLRPIAEEIRAWGDGSRTFFCVGDPKQAIYGWRGGCADLFDQIEEDLALEPGSGERLDESFRSSQVVLDAVNRVFGGLRHGRRAGGARRDGRALDRPAFGEHRARRDLPGFVELVESPAGERSRRMVAARLAELAASMPDASIAVLVQTNDQAAAALDALRRAGVEASGEGAGAVADDPAVAAVIAALVLADHPGDTIAAFHVASSPLGGGALGPRDPTIEPARRSRRGPRALAPAPRRSGRARRGGGARVVAPGAARRDRNAQPPAPGAGGRPRRAVRSRGRRPARRSRALPVARRGREPAAVGRAGDDDSPRQGPRVRRRRAARARSPVAAPLRTRAVYLLRRSPLAPVEAVHRSVAAERAQARARARGGASSRSSRGDCATT